MRLRVAIVADPAVIVRNVVGTFFTLRLRQNRVAKADRLGRHLAADDPTDEELLLKVSTGEELGLSLLFRRYAPLVRSVGRRILRNGTEAEDLVQDVFLYLHRRSDLFDSQKGSARSWIVQVAYTQAFLRRRRLRSLGFYLSGIEDKPRESESISSDLFHYDDCAEARFGRELWRKTVDSLSQEQRQTLRLHFLDGYTFREIAEKLGQSYANVRNHYYRGLERLRQQLAPKASDRP